MTQFFGFSPSRLALSYVALSVLVLALFAIPLWYAWSVNIATFKEYVHAEDIQRMVGVLEREGAGKLGELIESEAPSYPSDQILVLADPSKSRVAGNLPAWPSEVPDLPGTYGLVIQRADSKMRVVASHVALPGGYHLLIGRESVRFQSLVDYFWFGIAGATVIAVMLGGLIGWMIRRALLFDVGEMSRTAAAIVEGDQSRRLSTPRGPDALANLARTVNGMLEQLAEQNEQLAGEIAIRRDAQHALRRAHDELETLVAQRTDALRRSEERYALAVDAAGDGHSDWIVATDEFYASPRLLEMGGLPPETVFASRADFLHQFPFHPDDRERVVNAIEAHFIAGTVRLEMDLRILRRGETRWLHLTGLCSRDSAGELIRWNTAITDVTDRKRADDALRLSEHRYALAMEATGDGHWDWDIPADKMYVSPLLLDMCGLPPDITFANGTEWVDRFPFHPGERPKYAQAVADHFAGKTERVDLEIRIVPRGETRWVHMTGRCSRDASGTPIRWAGSVTDITARKRVDDELRARQDMLDLAQKVARAVAFEWRVGAGEGENRWSPDIEAMYGIETGTYDGTYDSWKKLVHPEDWPDVRAAIKSAQETGDVAAEYRVVHRDGAIRWLQAKGRMFFDPQGKPARIVGFMLDVTDRRAAEEELQRMEQQLRQAQRLESIGTLAGGIAHDFNNLLGAILGYGEMALRDAPPGSRLRRDLDNIMIAGERGRALIDRILAFSRSGVGERVAVHVEDVTRETLALLAPKLPQGVVIEERLRAGAAAILGDATQIHQVLMNLVTNAVQAMPSGGSLRVSLDTARVDGARIAATGAIAAGDYVVLEIADSGSGIAPESMERIFDPFFTTKEIGVGTGLGLSLVHGIVTGLGGAIDVASTLGEGSVFTVYLPCAGDVAMPTNARSRDIPETSRGGRERVLIVDDEESLVRLVTETLTELGYSTAGFTSSAAALDAFLADPLRFDAVITDESMPGISGSELVRRVRMVRPTIPILLLSGYLSAAVLRRATDAGASEVLKKPLAARQLAAALDRVLHGSPAPGASDINVAAARTPTATPQQRDVLPATSRLRSRRG